MIETATLLEPGFSTADAGYPTFSLRDGVLILEFKDWRERRVRVRFPNTSGLRWQELDSPGPQDRDESVYEILRSSWLADYVSQGARTAAEGLRHYRLCFNAVGVLDVLAASIEVEDAG